MATRTTPTTTLGQSIRRWASVSIGTSGAIRNCRRELEARARAEQVADGLRARIADHGT